MSDDEPDLKAIRERARDDFWFWLDQIGIRPPVINGRSRRVFTYPRRTIDEKLASGELVERDGEIVDPLWDALVIEDQYLPPAPQNHPPKPETAFWRGAPRRRR